MSGHRSYQRAFGRMISGRLLGAAEGLRVRLSTMRSDATMTSATRSWKVAVDTVVRARIDSASKDKATEALAAMGLSVSDAIRLLTIRIAADHELPFPMKAPGYPASINEFGGGSNSDAGFR